jgi:hypothetical protein
MPIELALMSGNVTKQTLAKHQATACAIHSADWARTTKLLYRDAAHLSEW